MLTFTICIGICCFFVAYLKNDNPKSYIQYRPKATEVLQKESKSLTVNITQPPHILAVFWSSFYRSYLGLNQSSSFIWANVEMTYNRSRLKEADFVFIHFRGRNDIPKYRHPRQKWVLHTMESPAHDGLNPIQMAKIDKLFNFTSHYSSKADIRSPYGVCSHIEKNVPKTNISFVNKTGVLVWAASHCSTSSKREKYINAMKKYIHVDIYGACGTLKHSKNGFDEILKKYKFYLSFENSFCSEYVTEKLYKIVEKPEIYVVPIVMGLTDYSSHIPQGSFIDVRNFTSPSHLAEHLHYLDKNDTAYVEYIRAGENNECHFGIAAISIATDISRLSNKEHIVGLSQLKDVFGGQNCISAETFYNRYNITI